MTDPQPPHTSVIRTADAPAAIGPYSQAIRSGDLLFLSGQIPLDPKTGELVSGSITQETTQVMQNLGGVLRAAGADYKHIVKITIFLTDMSDFAEMNAAYASYFDQNPPARATVQVAGLPKGVRVEIDAIARIAD